MKSLLAELNMRYFNSANGYSSLPLSECKLDRTSRYPDMDFHQYPTDETYRTASVETGNQQIKINEI